MIKVDFKTAKDRQKLLGFGTSACWWSHKIPSPEVAQELAELLYGESGLGLNIYRYNVGAGWDENNCRVNNPWRRVESFYIYDDDNESEHYHGGGYDWERDRTAYNFMKLCLETGRIDTVVLFANSPHYAFTASGQASGGIMHHTTNLPKSNYKRFVDYYLDITEHFIEDGIPVNYISPINEPQWKWGGKHVWQEGCHYEPDEVYEILHLFAEGLEKRGLDVKLYTPESGELFGVTEQYFERITADELIMKHLGVFAVHSYHSDRDLQIRKSFYEKIISKNPQIRFDMSEWCELPCKHGTKTVESALIAARIIGWDLTELGAQTWTSWVAVNQIADFKGDGRDYSDGLLSASDSFAYYYICKRYYAFAHFAKFLPIGSTVLESVTDKAGGLNLFMFKTPQNESILVAVNEGRSTEIEINANAGFEQIYSTTEKKSLKLEYDGEFNPTLRLKGKSITTVKLWK